LQNKHHLLSRCHEILKDSDIGSPYHPSFRLGDLGGEVRVAVLMAAEQVRVDPVGYNNGVNLVVAKDTLDRNIRPM
jgi:hypothetical protein